MPIPYLLLGLFQNFFSADADVVAVTLGEHIPNGLKLGLGLRGFEDVVAKKQELLVGRGSFGVGRRRFRQGLCRLIFR